MTVRVLFQPFFYLPEAWNGIDEHLLLLSRHLDRKRFELVLAATSGDGTQTETLAQRAGLSLARLPEPASARLNSLVRLRNFYEEVGADVVHMHTPAFGGQARFGLAARAAGAVPLVTVHQIMPNQLSRRGRVTNRLAQRVLFGPIVAVSKDVRQMLATHAGLDARPISVIPNGVDEPAEDHTTRDEGTTRESLQIGYFGRLSHEKGVDLLIDALAVVSESGRGFTALIVGDGPERSQLQAQVERLGLTERVRFMGFQSNVDTFMRSVDIVAHTPRYEGFGLVVLEAMARGVPVVVSPAPGGIPEMVVSGETGLVTNGMSAHAIANGLAEVIDNADLRAAMGAAGFQRWKRLFTAERMACRTAEVYERTLKLRSVSPTRGSAIPRKT